MYTWTNLSPIWRVCWICCSSVCLSVSVSVCYLSMCISWWAKSMISFFLCGSKGRVTRITWRNNFFTSQDNSHDCKEGTWAGRREEETAMAALLPRNCRPSGLYCRLRSDAAPEKRPERREQRELLFNIKRAVTGNLLFVWNPDVPDV